MSKTEPLAYAISNLNIIRTYAIAVNAIGGVGIPAQDGRDLLKRREGIGLPGCYDVSSCLAGADDAGGERQGEAALGVGELAQGGARRGQDPLIGGIIDKGGERRTLDLDA